ncbi:ATP-binding protein [Streptomyces longwoodensis]|uniref:ATP-binding protein n=1 Tax=Streptomyces longwoodensis TaxID=68231 RepID=UPI0033F605E3
MLSNRTAGDVMLIVSELITNAARHDGGPRLLDLTCTQHEVEVTVWDTSAQLPTRLPRDPHRIGGHGIEIVTTLCSRFLASAYQAANASRPASPWHDPGRATSRWRRGTNGHRASHLSRTEQRQGLRLKLPRGAAGLSQVQHSREAETAPRPPGTSASLCVYRLRWVSSGASPR